MIERMANENIYEMEPLEGYESMEFEAKNATKYMATFPYPYMNGFLHLGKSSPPTFHYAFKIEDYVVSRSFCKL